MPNTSTTASHEVSHVDVMMIHERDIVSGADNGTGAGFVDKAGVSRR